MTEIETLHEVVEALRSKHFKAEKVVEKCFDRMRMAEERGWDDAEFYQSNFLQAQAHARGIFDSMREVMESLDRATYYFE